MNLIDNTKMAENLYLSRIQNLLLYEFVAARRVYCLVKSFRLESMHAFDDEFGV